MIHLLIVKNIKNAILFFESYTSRTVKDYFCAIPIQSLLYFSMDIIAVIIFSMIIFANLKNVLNIGLKGLTYMVFRYRIVNKHDKKCIGTVKICPYFIFFVGEEMVGILRFDIISKFEKYVYMDEIYSTLACNLYNYFNVDILINKAVPNDLVRLKVLKTFV